MIEIQCTSCHTRYRIDERVLPDDTPTFKCSRCGHVFNADALPAKTGAPAARAVETDSQPAQMLRTPRASAPRQPVNRRDVVREAIAPSPAEQPEFEPTPEHNEHPQQESAASASISERETEPDHPLNRTFGDREQKADTGENFKFDFSDEGHDLGNDAPEDESAAPAGDDDRWQVGDAPPEFDSEPDRYVPTTINAVAPASRPAPASTHQVAAALKAARPRAQPAHPAESAGFELGDRADEAADLPAPGKTHSSGYFLAMFFVIAIGFVATSSLICSEPLASARLLGENAQLGPYFARPIVPAMLVALHDVHSEYRTLKGGQVALVITGTAQNVGGRRLHLVQIGADLIGGGAHSIARQSVYCGNELSAKMLGEMTPREIEFSQGLSPQKSFAMEPSDAAPFLMVFVNPPPGAGNLRLSVLKAVAAESPEPVSGAPARRS